MNARRILPLLLIAAIVLAAWWFTGPSPELATNAAYSDTTAAVEIAPVVRKTIAETVTSYGSVIAQPGKLQTVSLAYEARVSHVLVAPGQPVNTDDPLVEIAASPATQLQFSQAQSAARLAQKELEQTRQRFDLKLATNQDLNSAQQAATNARLQLDSLQREGADSAGFVRARSEGIVANVPIQGGQIVTAGSALVEIIATNAIEAKIGVEPEDLPALSPGQTVVLSPVNQPDSRKISATVRLVTRRINPVTRLVDVYVTLPPDSGLLLDGYLRAEFRRESIDALVVPRSAVLPQGDAWQLFTVRDGHADAHAVRIGIIANGEVEIVASDLSVGEPVVTLGNYELEDGMAVDVAK